MTALSALRTLATWLALLLIFAVPCETILEYPVLGSVARLLGLALAGTWIAAVIVRGQTRRPVPFHAALAVFVAWCALSILWSRNPDRSWDHALTWLQLLLLALIFWDLFTTHAGVRSALQAFVLGGYAAVGSVVQNYLAGSTFYYERFSAAGVSPDDLGTLLAVGIPLAVYLAAAPRAGLLMRSINLLYVPAALAGIALSATRTAAVAAVPGILFGLVAIAQTKMGMVTRLVGIVLIAAGVAGVVAAVPQASWSRLQSTTGAVSTGDLNGRTQLWKQGLASLKEHPLAGVGANMYRSVNVENKVAHNSFISVLVELGLVGLALFLTVLVFAFLPILRHTGWDRIFWLTTLTAWAISASMLTWEYRKGTWVFLGLAVCSSALVRRDEVTAQESVAVRGDISAVGAGFSPIGDRLP